MSGHRTPRRAKAKRRASRVLGGLAQPSLLEFITDPELLGPYFSGPTWDLWKAVLKAATAEPMTARERKLFDKVSGGRKPPATPVRELAACVGRGGGKDAIASAAAAHRAVTSDFSRLRPGERGVAMVLATDRDQAGIAHGFVGGYFERVPLLAAMVESETADELHLTNGASIIISTANTRAPRGRTICAAVYDELAFWRSDESAFPDVDVDAAVSPGLLRFPGSLKVMISSVNRRSGLLYERFAEFYGKDSDDVLVVLGTSLDFNPTLDRASIERDLERDPERYGAEYLSLWRTDIGDFLDRELVDAAVERGITVRSPAPGIEYVAFADPSGGRGNSFTCAIAHADETGPVLDCIFERRAPFDADAVVDEVAALLRNYRIARVSGDGYAGNWVSDSFARRGVRYVASELKRSDLYVALVPLLTSGRARLLDVPRLRHQLIGLERRTTHAGRDEVRPPRGGADDVANSVTGALLMASLEAAPSLIRGADLLRDDKPVPLPRFAQAVFATLIVGADGQVAIAYFASHDFPWADDPAPLVLIDVAVEPLTNSTVLNMFGRLEELYRAIPKVLMCTAFVPHAYLEHVQLAGWSSDEIPPEMLRDLPTLALAAAGHVNAGHFKIAKVVAEKERTLPLGGALTCRPGEKLDDDALRLAILVGIGLGLSPRIVFEASAISSARLVAA